MLWLTLLAGCTNADGPAASQPLSNQSTPDSAAQTAPASALDAQIISTILLRKAACDRSRPGFRELSARAFERWRRFGRQAIDAVERSSEFQVRLTEVANLPVGDPREADGQEAAAICGDDFIAHIAELGRDADPRMVTPEATWRAFVVALRAADRTSALDLMTETTREHQRRRFDGQPDQSLRATGEGFVRFELKDSLGPYRVAVATRRDGTTQTVFFDQSWNGDWRIAAL